VHDGPDQCVKLKPFNGIWTWIASIQLRAKNKSLNMDQDGSTVKEKTVTLGTDQKSCDVPTKTEYPLVN
jgi:hypothetical protein